MEAAAPNKEEFSDTDPIDISFSKRGCCFWIPCFNSNQSPGIGSRVGSWERIQKAEKEQKWWRRGLGLLKKVKEWSEVVAGPRWKTFLRKFNRKARGAQGQNANFRYDPFSYALNFDEGHGEDDHSNEYWQHNFSVRYATIPTCTKSSMDFGANAPDFTIGPH